MELFINTIKLFIEQLNSVLALQDSEKREKIIIKNTMQFYIKSAKYAKELGFIKSDKAAIYKAKDEMDFVSLIERFNMKAPNLIDITHSTFFNYSMKLEFENILAIFIRTLAEMEYYKENNWYPTQFVKDIIIISILIRTTIYFPVSMEEEKLKKSITNLTRYPRKENEELIYKNIDEYIAEKSVEIFDNRDIARDYLRVHKLNSVDNLIGLLSEMELNNVRIMDIIADLQNFEAKGVVINRYIIKGYLLSAFIHTISDYPMYYENEGLYYDIVLRLSQILRAIHNEVRIEKE